MIYVGIDIAKNSHVAAIVSNNGEVLTEPFPFDNTIQGFTLLLSSMSKFDKTKILIGLEATGHYGENLIQFLFQKEYNIVQLNPLQTASARKSAIRKTKTDKADTFAIIKVLMFEDVHSISAKDIDHIALRSLCNARRSLVTHSVRLVYR